MLTIDFQNDKKTLVRIKLYMKNSEIIKTLVGNYISINNDSHKQELVLDKTFYDKENKKYNQKTLTQIDNNQIDLLLIGDNPGKKEMEKQEYFSKSGFAGKYARNFLDIASFYHSYEKEPFNFLIFNKTPFFSRTTNKLEFDSDLSVKKSCLFLIESLSKFALNNPNLIILIVGRYKENELNQVFFPLLYNQVKKDVILSQKIRFANHFRNGHFYDQWIRNDWIGIKSIDGSSFHSTLNRIHEETYPKINSDFNLKFMQEAIIQKLNKTLTQLANGYKNNFLQINYDSFGELLIDSGKYSDMTLLFSEEVERDLNEFINFDEKKLSNFRELKSQEESLKNKKKEYVKNKEFEKAAQIRDKIKSIEDKILQELIQLNHLQEGFNSYKGCIMVVISANPFKSMVLEKFIKEKRKAHNTLYI